MSLACHCIQEEDPHRRQACLLPFRPICLLDKPCFDRAMRELNDDICDCAFADQYIWREKYQTEICHHEGAVMTRLTLEDETTYGFPAGGSLGRSLRALIGHCHRAGERLRLGFLSDEMRRRIEAEMPGSFLFEEKRDSADYLYRAEKMINLTGQKLHSKRNFINRFRTAYDGHWTFEAFDPDQTAELFEYEARWCRDNRTSEGDLAAENQAIVSLLENACVLDVKGGVLRLDGQIIGFSLGTFINPDVFCVHIEKADWMIAGAYQVLANELARMYCQDIAMINREDDMGIEGLRKAKMSYQPDKIAMKYIATLA